MGVYYKLVNRVTKERIEPDMIGGGGIKFGALIAGPSSKLLMFLHLKGQQDWTVLGDTGDEYSETEKEGSPGYLADMTEVYRQEYNLYWDGQDHIEQSKWARPPIGGDT